MLPSTDSDSPVVVLLAGPVGRVNTWYAALMADARFRVLSFATDPEDLSRKLAGHPEVVVVDADIFPGPAPLLELLTRVDGTAYVVLPAQADANTRATIGGLACVKGVYAGDANLAALTGKMHADAVARRQMAPGSAADWNNSRRGTAAVAGLRIIAVWNQTGGCGKSTLSGNLAYESARRGFKTLLIGLGAPDTLPLTLGLNAQPNITLWRANPSRESFTAALQKAGDLDVLAGFPDVMAEDQALRDGPEAAGAVTQLALTAAYAGYAVIVLDTPHSPLAGQALAAANTLLLVARPTLADAWCSVEAYRTLTERLQGQHRLSPENVFVALNRARPASLPASEWQATAAGALKRPFPAVAATFNEQPEIEAAQNAGKPALLQADGFARQLHTLADALLGTTTPRAKPEPAPGKAWKFGPVTLRAKG